MPLQLLTPPAAEPLHLGDAIAHIKQDAGIDDAHILATIVAARKSVENRTWRTHKPYVVQNEGEATFPFATLAAYSVQNNAHFVQRRRPLWEFPPAM